MTRTKKARKSTSKVAKAKRQAPRTRHIADAGNERIVTEMGSIDLASRTISNSGRSTFQDCNQKWLLDYGYRLRRRGLKDYFWVGRVAHDEWERMYLSGKFNLKASRKRIETATRAAVKECVNKDQEDRIWKASAMVQGLLPAYASHYLERDLKHHEILSAEEGFEVAIPGTDWTYVGFSDIISRVTRTDGVMKRGDLVLWENKTTGQMDVNYIAKLPLDYQILGYCWGVREKSGYGTPKWVMYNASLKSRLRQKQTENFGQFLDRVEADYAEDPTKYFYREVLQFDDHAIDMFVDELSRWIIENLEPALMTGYFSKNTRQCTIRGLCDFMPICTGAIPLSEALLHFERKEKSPRELKEEMTE